MTGAPIFDRMALIGIGLIGSSLAQVARQRGLVKEIAISTRSAARPLQRAEELGLGDSYALDAAEAVEGADLVILCVPVGANEAVAKWIAPALKKGAILTDAGSTKESVVEQVSPHVPDGVHFIPGHPIAGTEHSGPDAGFPTLFDQRWCILTPPENTDPDALAKLKAFWEGCGSDVDMMEPKHHDLVLAIVSHLPHLIAYNIVGNRRRPCHCDQVTGDQVFRVRFPRLHATGRVRSDHVARCLPEQQGSHPGDAFTVLRGFVRDAAGDSLGRRRDAV